MATFGEFYDRVKDSATKSGNEVAIKMMEDWLIALSNSQWHETRSKTLGRELFLCFTESMTVEFKILILKNRGEHLYHELIQKGHEFLKAIAELGEKCGMQKSLCATVDVPLSLSDTVSMSEKRS